MLRPSTLANPVDPPCRHPRPRLGATTRRPPRPTRGSSRGERPGRRAARRRLPDRRLFVLGVWTDASMGWSAIRRRRSDRLPAQGAGRRLPSRRWQSRSGGLPISLENLPTLTFGDAPGQPVPALFCPLDRPELRPEPRPRPRSAGTSGPTAPTLDPRRTTTRTNERGIDFDPPATLDAWRAPRRRAARPAPGDARPLARAAADRPPPRGHRHARARRLRDRPRRPGNLARPLPRGQRLPPDRGRPSVDPPPGRPLARTAIPPNGRVDADVQARCARLAQLGCVVFLYDMVGYADGKPFGHSWTSDRLGRYGLSLAGLQAWNSLRGAGLPGESPRRRRRADRPSPASPAARRRRSS